MATERDSFSGGFKVGEDWTETLEFRADGTPFDWTGCSAKLTMRYGEGETAPEAFTLATGGSGITLTAPGLMTLSYGRAASVSLTPGDLTGDLLVIDAAGNSNYYLDVYLTVAPRSTVR